MWSLLRHPGYAYRLMVNIEDGEYMDAVRWGVEAMARQQSCPYANKDCTLTFWVLVGHQHLLIDGLMTRLTPLLAVKRRISTYCCSIDGALGRKRRDHYGMLSTADTIILLRK